MFLPEGVFNTFCHLGVCVVVGSQDNCTPKVLTRLRAPKRSFQTQKTPLSQNTLYQEVSEYGFVLSGPLDRLNAILSLLQPLDRYRAPSAIGSAIGVALSRPILHPRAGRSSQPPRSKPLRGLNRAIVAL